MIALYEYYFDNFHKNSNSSYDYKYFNVIEKYTKEFNILKKRLNYYDDKQIINEWRLLLYPSNENVVIDIVIKEAQFYFLSFYLMNENYEIVEFPTELENTKGLRNFTDNILYHCTAEKYGRETNGSVKWKNRRALIDSLTIKKKSDTLPVSLDLKSLMTKISTRGADFYLMSDDEKLQNIRDAYEHIICLFGGFSNIDFSSIFKGYIEESNLKEYSKKLHCFRHGNPNALSERNAYTIEEKHYMIDFGLVILNRLYCFLPK